VRVGIDDTDSPRGGCTTWALTELARLARDDGLDLIGAPHLVRLNPNIPWKTRGNAALSMRLGHGLGTPTAVGELDGRPVVAYHRGREPDPDEAARYVEEARRTVTRLAPRDRGTDPALVVTPGPLPSSLYWTAVRDRTTLGKVEPVLRRAGATTWVRSGRRGLIGASAAIAWPARRATWELIAYRRPAAWGTSRRVDAATVLAAQRAWPELFLCHDPRTRRLLVAPHTACPILFGLRGTTPEAPRAALGRIRSEPVDRWMLFRTNQATGDHLVPRSVPALRGYRAGWVRGSVDAPVSVLPGGHVRFDLRDRAGQRLVCLAFEPTKTLPDVARALVAGDRLRVWGSRGPGGALRLEGIEVLALASPGRWRAPRCDRCAGRCRSLGSGRGWKCPRCRLRLPPERAGWSPVPRTVAPGTYHPTPSARRHLAPRAPETGPTPVF